MSFCRRYNKKAEFLCDVDEYVAPFDTAHTGFRNYKARHFHPYSDI